MIKKLYFRIAVVSLFLCIGSLSGYAQKPADAVADIPELVSFHEVIFKIWHEAWPNKNTAMLKDLAPSVEEGIAKVSSARLPGILREKKPAWEQGIEKLKNAGALYKAAATADDSARLLTAAEKLHKQFEALMRLTRPVLKELEDFHSSLYMLFHYYLPEYDIEKIRTSAEELKQKMQALMSATLPERFQSKNPDFMPARRKLAESVEALNSIVGTGSKETIKKAIDDLHKNYQDLQKIFD
jgi:hypothetical protein